MRGTGSLYALLGRDPTKKRPRNGSNSLQKSVPSRPERRSNRDGASSAEAGSLPDEALSRERNWEAAPADSPAGAAAATVRPRSPPPAGNVCCPVCSVQLAQDNDRINEHIDKCLSKGALRAQTKQASIFQFTVPKAPATQQQQQQSNTPQSPVRRRGAAAAATAAALAAGAAAAASEIIDVTGDADAGEALGGSDAEQEEQVQQQQRRRQLPPHQQPAKQQRQQAVPVESESVSWDSQDSLCGSAEDVEVQQPARQAAGPKEGAAPNTQQAQQQQQASAQGLAPTAAQLLLRTPTKRQAAAAPGSLRSFACAVVGRQFLRHEAPCQSGQRLVVEHEADNPRDAHALQALDAHSRVVMGHLPHVVSRHLAPLLCSGQVLAEAVVLEDPLTEQAPLRVELQIALQPPASGSSPGRPGRMSAALGRAESAAAAQLQQQPQATGERLHSNFLKVLETVQQHDAHLLAEPEVDFIAAYKALPLASQCLFLRLFQRKGTLFSLASLSYREIPDVGKAATELAAARLAAVVSSDSVAAAAAAAAAAAGGAGSSAAGGEAAEQDAVSWRQLATLLTVPELAGVLAARRIQAAVPAATGGGNGRSDRVAAPAGLRNRDQLLAAMEAHAALSPAASAVLAGWLLEAAGPVLRLAAPACEAVCRLQRLFFLNEGHNLSQFLASDLGAVQYPQYQVHRSCPAFRSRAELVRYEQALGHAGQLSEALENEDAEGAQAVLQHVSAALDAGMHKQERAGVPAFLQRFHAGWVYCTMATVGVSLLEQQRQYKDAVQRLEQLLGGMCCPTRRGDWWVRLTTDLEHLKRPAQALERAESALADKWLSNGDRLALQRRILRLGKPPRRWKRPHWAEAALREPPEVRIVARPLNNTTGLKSRFYGLDDEQCSVEELALQHYATEEGGAWQGTHSENGTWATLFGLLLWDVLFMPVPDVFRTPFQTAPLDLDTPDFYVSRKAAVEACLSRVAAGEAPRLLRLAWEQHQGVMCRGVSWERHSLEELQLVAECIGGPGLAAVCRLLARDHAGWSGGMPDLLLWRAATRDAKLAEVKGPRDRLSSSQTAWMNALAGAGLQAEVLKVVEPEAANGKKRRR